MEHLSQVYPSSSPIETSKRYPSMFTIKDLSFADPPYVAD